MPTPYIAVELIQKKKRGQELTADEISWLIKSFTTGDLPDYQMSALAMAIYFQGLSATETACLTLAMRDSGRKFSFSHLNAARVDKHSTGGVGDKTSLIIGPIWAAAQVHAPMIAGRGLGHTGGTLDKLESIDGFRISLSPQEFSRNVERYFYSIMGQTSDICPADKKLYALRDVTATVDSIPLICASIMSKKLAEDLTGLVLDVKFGSGAFMKDLNKARELARVLVKTGQQNGVKVHALLTNMDEPLGRFAGNSLEIEECLDILQNKTAVDNEYDFYSSTRELSLQLAAHGLFLVGRSNTLESARTLCEDILKSGQAYKAFLKLCEYQGPARLDRIHRAAHETVLSAPRKGFLKIDTERIGFALVALGAGRKKTTDTIDYTAGVEFLARAGQPLQAGQPLCRIFHNQKELSTAVRESFFSGFQINNEPQEPLPLIAEVLT